jgi:RNA polymerase sigma factor (sigma-70 family)
VSVVCRNAFLNHVRTQAEHASIDAGEAPEPLDEHAAAAHELPFVHAAVEDALAALPDYLEDVARLYFLDGYTYAEIAEQLEKSVPTLRAYKQRIVKQLRDDPGLSTFLDELGHED